MVDRHILDEAALWYASMSGDQPDFDGFALWLEADPAHRVAYDRLVMLDDAIDQNRAELHVAVPANDSGDVEPRRRWFVPAIAASIAAMVIAVWQITPGTDPVTTSTGVGEVRSIALGNDAQINLDAQTSIAFDADDHRNAELLQGRAFFAVRHDPAQPFTLTVGDYQVRDLGTKFEVRHDGDTITVSVTEGSVSVGGGNIGFAEARSGDRIEIANGTVRKTRTDAASVGSWRDGRLIYDNAPLAQVVADINRYAKKKLALDPSLTEQRFSGVLTVEDGSQLARNLADLMGLPLADNGESLVLRARR